VSFQKGRVCIWVRSSWRVIRILSFLPATIKMRTSGKKEREIPPAAVN